MLRRTILSLLNIISLGILTALFLSGPSALAQDGAVTAFVNVSVLPMDGQTSNGLNVLDNQTVIISGDRILSVSDAESTDIPDGAILIDGEGRFLMPGFGEMHGHIPPLSQGEQQVNDTLFLYLSNGVTTVRGMLGSPGQLQLREDAKSGARHSPTLYLAGPSFNGNSISSPEEAEKSVTSQVTEGWDLLKVHPGLTREEYDAMALRAKALEIDFGGHVPEEVGLIHSLVAGQRTLDHLDGYMAYLDGFSKLISDEDFREIARKTKNAGVGVVPTSALWKTLIGAGNLDDLNQYDELKYIRPEVVQSWRDRIGFLTEGDPQIHEQNRLKLLKILQEEGVEILFGTDAPQLFSVPGFSIHHEIDAMEAAGLKNIDILRSGTSAIGAYFKDVDQFGTIAPNMRADLILLESNPLDDLDNLKSPAGVMVRGTWLSRPEIEAELAAIEARARP
jgi:hypothetical protein